MSWLTVSGVCGEGRGRRDELNMEDEAKKRVGSASVFDARPFLPRDSSIYAAYDVVEHVLIYPSERKSRGVRVAVGWAGEQRAEGALERGRSRKSSLNAAIREGNRSPVDWRRVSKDETGEVVYERWALRRVGERVELALWEGVGRSWRSTSSNQGDDFVRQPARRVGDLTTLCTMLLFHYLPETSRGSVDQV